MTRKVEDKGALLVLAQRALGMLQVDMAGFLSVSDRTMRRWAAGGVHLTPRQLDKLVTAVHPRDPALAGRIAAAHGEVLEALLRRHSDARDPVADRRLRDALVRAAAQEAGVSSAKMRAALTTALAGARSAGMTLDEAHALFAERE